MLLSKENINPVVSNTISVTIYDVTMTHRELDKRGISRNTMAKAK